MTQRIFDKDNEKDMADLWDILPEETAKIKGGNNQPSYLFDSDDKAFDSISQNIIKINWHDATEITRPVNYEDMIGCVGWFWDNDDEEKSLGVLTEYSPETGFPFVKGNNDNTYSNFCPAKKSELKFWGED